MKNDSRKQEILDIAQNMIQKWGYNRFSYADIADEIGIRKASLHHHFSSKTVLVVAIIQRYRESFKRQLEAISAAENSWLGKIRQYGNLYAEVLKQNKLCLCGMLASDIETLPQDLKHEIKIFFQENITWLGDVLKEHDKDSSHKKNNDIAWQIISSLQGAIMLARMQSDENVFHAASNELYTQLSNKYSGN